LYLSDFSLDSAKRRTRVEYKVKLDGDIWHILLSSKPMLRRTKDALTYYLINTCNVKQLDELKFLEDFVIEERNYEFVQTVEHDTVTSDTKQTVFLKFLDNNSYARLVYNQATIKGYPYFVKITDESSAAIVKYLRGCKLKKQAHFLNEGRYFAFKSEEHVLLLRLHTENKIDVCDLRKIVDFPTN
jgi:hypothetical protein